MIFWYCQISGWSRCKMMQSPRFKQPLKPLQVFLLKEMYSYIDQIKSKIFISLTDMATNGTGVNEAIAVVLKAAKAVAGENWSENERSENGSEMSEKKERKKHF